MEQTPDGNADMVDDWKRLRNAPGLGIMRPLMTKRAEQCGKRKVMARFEQKIHGRVLAEAAVDGCY